MSDWGWVTLGYASVYGVIAAYGALLVRRVARARSDANAPTGSSSAGAG